MSSVAVARCLRSRPDPRRGVLWPIRFVLIVLILGLLALEARAQEEPRAVETSAADVSLTLSGTLQYRLSYGFDDGVDGIVDERLGFGIRRARFRATAELANRFGAHFD